MNTERENRKPIEQLFGDNWKPVEKILNQKFLPKESSLLSFAATFKSQFYYTKEETNGEQTVTLRFDFQCEDFSCSQAIPLLAKRFVDKEHIEALSNLMNVHLNDHLPKIFLQTASNAVLEALDLVGNIYKVTGFNKDELNEQITRADTRARKMRLRMRGRGRGKNIHTPKKKTPLPLNDWRAEITETVNKLYPADNMQRILKGKVAASIGISVKTLNKRLKDLGVIDLEELLSRKVENF